MKFSRYRILIPGIIFGFLTASSFFIITPQTSAYMPDWVQKKVDDYHKSDNKLAGLLGLIYSFGGIVVFFSYAPQFYAQIKKNKQISTLTFSLFGTVNTVGLAYAITSGTTPLMVTMFPATFWCWLMVITNEIKRRRGDFEVNVHSLLRDLKGILDPGNTDHLDAFRKLFGGVGFTNKEQIQYLVQKMKTSNEKLDEFVRIYTRIVQDSITDMSIRERLWRYLDTLSFPASEYDLAGRPVFLNKAFIEVTWYTRDELFQAEDIVKLLYKWKEYEFVRSALDVIKKDKEWYMRRVFTLTTKDGKSRTIHWTTQPSFDESGKVIGTIRFGIDTEESLDARLDAIAAL